MLWATIVADASFCPDTRVGGYGFWVATSRGKLGDDGVLKAPINNISAEMMALLNAVHFAMQKGLVRQGEGILLQTDCQAAIDAFTNKRTNITDQELELVAWFTAFILDNNLRIRFKHVKGHTNKVQARFRSNNACDRRAKRQMRKARDLYKMTLEGAQK